MLEISIKCRIRRKSTFMCNVRNRFIRFLQKFTGRLDPHSINIFQRAYFHIRCKNSSKMCLTDMTVLRQIFHSNILHIIIRNLILCPCDHICNFSCFFFHPVFFGLSVHSCNFCQERTKYSFRFLQVKLLSVSHNI